MSHEEFLKLARAIYASLLRCLQGVQAQNQIITALLEPISYVTSRPFVSFPVPTRAFQPVHDANR